MQSLSSIQPLLRLSCISLALTACSVVQTPDYSGQADDFRNNQPEWQQPAATHSAALQNDQNSPASLVSLIELPGLEQQIELAFAANPDLLQTATTLRIAQQQLGVSQADQYPQLSAGIDGSSNSDDVTQYNSNLTVSWALDIWGKLANSVDASEAQLLAAQSSLVYARDLLAAQIITARLQLIQQQQLIRIAEAQLKILNANEAAIVERYRSGLSDLTDLDNARSSSESQRATLAQYQENLAQTQRTLSLLMGGNESSTNIDATFPQVLMPLTSLASQDLGRRPDLLSAYAEIKQAEANSRVAYKALLPSFSLQAAITDTDSSLTNALFSSTSWNLLGQLTAPLFNAGSLRSQAEVARLQAEQKYLAYQQTLLTAVNEVENALGQEKALDKRQHHIAAALDNARRSVAVYQDKYRQGLATFLELTQVQQQTFSLETQLTEIIYQRLNNRITLGLALGLGAQS